MSAELAIAGPLDKLVITGPVRLSNTQLANFDLGSKLGAWRHFVANRNRVATHRSRTPAVNARVAPEGTRADNINLTVSAIGVITGSGTISPAGALAFKMVAALSGGVVGGLTKVAGIGGGGGQSQIPFAEPRSKPVTKPLAGGSQ